MVNDSVSPPLPRVADVNALLSWSVFSCPFSVRSI